MDKRCDRSFDARSIPNGYVCRLDHSAGKTRGGAMPSTPTARSAVLLIEKSLARCSGDHLVLERVEFESIGILK